MEKFTKKKQINEIKDGESIDDIFVVKVKKNISTYTGGFFFTLVLTDSSGGSINYKYWGGPDENEVKELFDLIKNDCVIYTRGKASLYNGKIEISSDRIGGIKVLNDEEYNSNDFVRKSSRNIDEMFSELISIINSLSSEEVKIFLKGIFESNIGELFKKCPGGISIHHNWVGGLVEHTLEVVKYCETAISINPKLDRDLLLTGAFLHDIGKIEELEVTSRIKGTIKGQFLGHLLIGLIFVSNKLEESDLNELFKEKLLHLIESHHGKLEYGSPKIPMIPEACVLFYADELSAKTAQMINNIEMNKDTTEDDFWYDYKSGNNIFLR
jgi:3'-5' exoribonuclease